MPIQVTIELTEIELETLENIIKKGSDWRERERALTIKLLHEATTPESTFCSGIGNLNVT